MFFCPLDFGSLHELKRGAHNASARMRKATNENAPREIVLRPGRNKGQRGRRRGFGPQGERALRRCILPSPFRAETFLGGRLSSIVTVQFVFACCCSPGRLPLVAACLFPPVRSGIRHPGTRETCCKAIGPQARQARAPPFRLPLPGSYSREASRVACSAAVVPHCWLSPRLWGSRMASFLHRLRLK